MKYRLPITAALIILALLSVASVRPLKPTAWEYTTHHDFRKANDLGAEGWELVATECVNGVCRYLFKRPKQ